MRAGVELCGAGHPARGNDVEPLPADTKIALSRDARAGWPAPQLYFDFFSRSASLR
jgi:hypothetical protein